MNKIAFMLSCLACVGTGQRVQSYPIAEALESVHPTADLASLLLALNPEASFSPSAGLHARMGHSALAKRRQVASMSDETRLNKAPQMQVTRDQFLKTMLAAAAAVPVMPALAISGLPREAIIEVYERYVPKIELGRDYWGEQLAPLIKNEDWKAISKAFIPANKKKGIPPGVIARLPPFMRLWATSFSSNSGISECTNAMNAAVDELVEAIDSLQIATLGEAKDNGLFAFLSGPKKLSEEERVKLATLAYKKGKSAINKYIKIANSEIVFVRELDLIE